MEHTCDKCEECTLGCTMHEESKIPCDKCEACADGCTLHEGE